MTVRLNQERLSYDDIRGIADGVLRQHSCRSGPPVQIEELVELDFGLEIVPFPGLLDELEVDGFTSSDLQTVYVDGSVYQDEKHCNRYRFTLAHELGHVVMHSSIFSRFHFATLEQYRLFVEETDEEDRGWLEYQAYSFGGLLLVPPVPLNEQFERQLGDSRLQASIREAREKALPREGYLEVVGDMLARRIGRHFMASCDTVMTRLKKDCLLDRIP